MPIYFGLLRDPTSCQLKWVNVIITTISLCDLWKSNTTLQTVEGHLVFFSFLKLKVMYQGWLGLITAAEPDVPANTGASLIHNRFSVTAAILYWFSFISRSQRASWILWFLEWSWRFFLTHTHTRVKRQNEDAFQWEGQIMLSHILFNLVMSQNRRTLCTSISLDRCVEEGQMDQKSTNLQWWTGRDTFTWHQ